MLNFYLVIPSSQDLKPLLQVYFPKKATWQIGLTQNIRAVQLLVLPNFLPRKFVPNFEYGHSLESRKAWLLLDSSAHFTALLQPLVA